MSSIVLAMGISAALFMSVFAVMSLILLLVLEAPYSYLLVTVLLTGSGIIMGRKVHDELSTYNKKERV